MLKRIAVACTVLGFTLVLSGISQAGELTVSGGNIYVQKSTDSVEVWNLNTDQDGYLLPDGAYKYEFRVMPEVDQEAREAAAESGDLQRLLELAHAEAEQVYLEAGTFEIVDGVAVAPEERENVDAQPENEVDIQIKDPNEGR